MIQKIKIAFVFGFVLMVVGSWFGASGTASAAAPKPPYAAGTCLVNAEGFTVARKCTVAISATVKTDSNGNPIDRIKNCYEITAQLSTTDDGTTTLINCKDGTPYAYPAGTCLVKAEGTTIVKKCSVAIPSSIKTDSNGNPIDRTKKCYSVSGQLSSSDASISQINCKDGTFTNAPTANPIQTCNVNGNDIPCSDVTDPAATSGNCNVISQCDLISKYLDPFVNFLAALVGVVIVISVVVGGIQYGSSAGDPQKASAARARIRNAVIALLTFLFLYALLNFIIPGGLI